MLVLLPATCPLPVVVLEAAESCILRGRNQLPFYTVSSPLKLLSVKLLKLNSPLEITWYFYIMYSRLSVLQTALYGLSIHHLCCKASPSTCNCFPSSILTLHVCNDELAAAASLPSQ